MAKTWVMAADIGATHVTAGLVSSRGEIEERLEVATHDSKGQAETRARIRGLFTDLKKRAESRGISPAGIAAGAPGIVDVHTGMLVAAGNIPELFAWPLGPDLEKEFKLPVQLENDVNAQAVGEMIFGVAQGIKNLAYFSLGTDLGGGIIIDGRLYRGWHAVGGEFGHLTLDLDGPRCACGGHGCASEWVSGSGIAKKARAAVSDASKVMALARGDRKGVLASHVFRADEDGDPEARALVEEFVKRLGAVISDVMFVLDPETVVLAGEVFRKHPGLIDRIQAHTRHYYFPLPGLPELRVSALTKETAVLGPAAAFFTAHQVPAGPGQEGGS